MKKTAFVTCVQLGLSCIEAVLEAGGHFDMLITLRDDMAREKSGRVYLDEVAAAHHIPLYKVTSINDPEVIGLVQTAGIDWMFVIGWSQIVHAPMLTTPVCGCIGIHPTLLPCGRGRAPIPWAILKGLSVTGVTMFRLDEHVDTGDMMAQKRIPMEPDMTATELYRRVDRAHVELMVAYWSQIMDGTIHLIPQDEALATYWPVRRPADGVLSHTMTREQADRLVRAVTHPYPGAFYEEDGRKVIVWSAATGTVEKPGSYRLADGFLYPGDTEVQETQP